MNAPSATASPSPWRASWSLARREIVRFVRQRNRVIGAVGQPILFWLLFGVGLDQSFRLQTADASPTFQEYLVPGTLVLILLFTAIFATISIIEDRREGFLQSVLVAPIPRWSMVLGKVAGGGLIALVQALMFLALALAVGLRMPWLDVAQLVLLLSIGAIGLTSLGFVLAWRMDSTQGFHAIMSLLLMPMWLLSGAFFPVPKIDDTSSVLQVGLSWIMQLNPLTYCVAGVRHLMFESGRLTEMPSPTTCWIVTTLFAVFAFACAAQVARFRIKGDLL